MGDEEDAATTTVAPPQPGTSLTAGAASPDLQQHVSRLESELDTSAAFVMGGTATDHPLPGQGETGGGGGGEGGEEDGAAATSGSDSASEAGGVTAAGQDLSPRWSSAAAAPPPDPAALVDPPLPPPQAPTPAVMDGRGGGTADPAPSAAASAAAFGPTLYPRPEDGASHVTVSDPVTNSEGMNQKYISYRVTVHPPRDPDVNNGAASQHTAVQRRYKDFHWLSTQLRRERPGSVVPPLPEKQAVSRLDPEFVEERRTGLEKFVRRCLVHPELADAECLETFLRADDLTFHAAKNHKGEKGRAGVHSQAGADAGGSPSLDTPSYNVAPVAAAPPQEPKKKNKLKNWFQETTTALSRDLVQSPDDHLFEEIGRYVDELEKVAKKCHHEADRLVKRRRDENGMYIELGKALNQLSSAEGGTDPTLGGWGRPAAVVGDACHSAIAPLCSDAAEAELHKFLEPLADHLRTLQSVRGALQKRADRRLTYTTALNTVTAKNAQMMKLRGSNPNNAASQMKLYDAELSLSRAQAAAEAGRVDYEAVSGRVLREVDRFKAEGARNIRATLAEFCAVQAEFHRRMMGGWADLVPRLGEIDLDSAAPAAPPAVMGGALAANPGAMAVPQGAGVPQQQPAMAAGAPPLPMAPPMPGAPPPPPPPVGGVAGAGMVATPHPPQNGVVGGGAAAVVTAPPPEAFAHAQQPGGPAIVGGMQYRDTSAVGLGIH